MVKFFIGLWIGGMIGLLFEAMAQMAGKDEEEIKREWISYKCKINEKAGCNDVCCKECEKYNECSMKCDGSPKTCGQGIIILN